MAQIKGDKVRVVTTRAVKNELCRMAGVDNGIPVSFYPEHGFIADLKGLARFMVCAVMLLGPADATMLASVVDEWTLDGEDHLEIDGPRVYTFPGWEVV